MWNSTDEQRLFVDHKICDRVVHQELGVMARGAIIEERLIWSIPDHKKCKHDSITLHPFDDVIIIVTIVVDFFLSVPWRELEMVDMNKCVLIWICM